MFIKTLLAASLLLTQAPAPTTTNTTAKIAQDSPIQIIDQDLAKNLFPDDAKLTTISSNLRFTEGPLWIPAQNPYLIFSDIPANTIYKWSPQTNKTTVFRKPSNNTNGNTLDNQGNLISCNHGSRNITRTNLQTNKITILLSTYKNQKFNSPNDAVVKSDDTLFFTDPSYGLGKRKKEQSGNHLFHFNPNTKIVSAVDTNLFYPNGLTLSPDEKTLYVADRPNLIYAYNVNKDNTLTKKRIFKKLPAGGPDGIRCDKQGNIWVSCSAGIIILSPDAKHIATIKTPKPAANLTFGGKNNQTLFITSRDKVFKIKTNAKGNK